MGNAFPTNQNNDVYYIIVNGTERIENKVMQRLSEQREKLLDEGHHVSEIKFERVVTRLSI